MLIATFFILALLGVASASGYQMVVSVGEAKQIKDMAITSLQVLIISEFFDIILLYVSVWVREVPHIEFLSVGMCHPWNFHVVYKHFRL